MLNKCVNYVYIAPDRQQVSNIIFNEAKSLFE